MLTVTLFKILKTLENQGNQLNYGMFGNTPNDHQKYTRVLTHVGKYLTYIIMYKRETMPSYVK